MSAISQCVILKITIFILYQTFPEMESKPEEEEGDSFNQAQVKSELDINVEEAHEAKIEEAFRRDDKLEGKKYPIHDLTFILS